MERITKEQKKQNKKHKVRIDYCFYENIDLENIDLENDDAVVANNYNGGAN